jgi:hypothetical protein
MRRKLSLSGCAFMKDVRKAAFIIKRQGSNEKLL